MVNTAHIRLHQLRALVAVVECGSIRAAARSQNLSQAALTKSLRGLEDNAGTALLLRKPSGVVLTPAGQRLIARAHLVTRQIDLAVEELEHAKGKHQGSIHVALTPMLTLTALGEAHRWFRSRFPAVQLHLHEGLVAPVLPRLRDGTLDFAIVANSGDVPPAEFALVPLRNEPQLIGARAGHPLANAKSLAQLANCEWILAGDASPAGPDRAVSDLLQLFKSAGLAAPTLLSRGHAMAAIALVRQSDALCIFPKGLLNQPETQGIAALDIQNVQIPELQFVQLALRGVPLTPPAAWFARCLRDASMGAATPELTDL